MAYTYKPNKYVIYDDSLTFEENYNNDAVITKKKLDNLEQQVKENSAELVFGSISFTDNKEKVKASITFDKTAGEKRIDFVLPVAGIDDITREEVIQTAIDGVFEEFKDEPYVTDDGVLYACGTPIVITAGTDLMNIATWYSHEGIKTLEFPVDNDVYGGDCRFRTDHRASYESTSIVMNSGSVNILCGAGQGACDVGVSTVVVNGGTVNRITGGGSCGNSRDNRTGRVHIILNNVDNDPEVYASSCNLSANTAELLLEINGGTYTKITVGGVDGHTVIAKVVVNGGSIGTLQGINKGLITDLSYEINDGEVTILNLWGSNEESSIMNTKLKVAGGSVTTVNKGENNLGSDVTGTYIAGVIGNEADLAELLPNVNAITSTADILAAIEKVLEDANTYTDKKCAEMDDSQTVPF